MTTDSILPLQALQGLPALSLHTKRTQDLTRAFLTRNVALVASVMLATVASVARLARRRSARNPGGVSNHMLREFVALEAYRLERNLDWLRLSLEMGQARAGVPPRTLYYWCKDRAPKGTAPLDRTMHRVRKFLVDVVKPSGALGAEDAAALAAHLATALPTKRAVAKARRATAVPEPSPRTASSRSKSAHL